MRSIKTRSNGLFRLFLKSPLVRFLPKSIYIILGSTTLMVVSFLSIIICFNRYYGGFCRIAISALYTRQELLKLYKEIDLTQYKEKFEVKTVDVVHNIQDLLATAVLKGDVSNVNTTAIYRFVLPLLTPYIQSPDTWLNTFTKILKIMNVTVIVNNPERIPKDGKLVVISNHLTLFDGLVLKYINQVRGPDNSSVLSVNYWGKYYNNEFKVHPNILSIVGWNGRLIPGGEDILVDRVNSGSALLIFPEGDLCRRKFKDGYMRVAMRSGASILPVLIEVEWPWWARAFHKVCPDLIITLLITFAFTLFKNKCITLTFGHPISNETLEKRRDQTYINSWGNIRYKQSVLDEDQKMIYSLNSKHI